MDISTPCMICGTDFAKYHCRICGSLVCDTDFDRSKGVCVDCSVSPKGAKKIIKRKI